MSNQFKKPKGLKKRLKRSNNNLLSSVASEVFDTDAGDIEALNGSVQVSEVEADDGETSDDDIAGLTDGIQPPPPPDTELPPLDAPTPPPLPETAKKPEVAKPASGEAEKKGKESKDKKGKFQKKTPIGEILVANQVINRDQLDYALTYQQDSARDKMLGEVLIELGILNPNNFGKLVVALLTQFAGSDIDLKQVGEFLDLKLLDKFKLSKYEKERFLPLRIISVHGQRTLEVFIEDETDLTKLDELRAVYGVPNVHPVGKFDADLLRTLIQEIHKERAKEIMPDEGGASDSITVLETLDETIDEDALDRAQDDNYISSMANKIIYDGVKRGASDIHIEYGEIPRVRYRVDGILQDGGRISQKDYPAVVSRFKIMSELDISERRVPQDGNIRLGIAGMGVIDFRVNTLPCSGNEKIVLRILDGNKLRDLTIDQLGWSEEILEQHIELMNRTQGMMLITGPTGSGKSTTLYSSMLYILDDRGDELNIATAEDPIEYKIEGINQSQLNEKVGLTFPSILKALLRQDPDIILVGEIRDLETASLAIKASQTGHFVFSTLHTNTAVATIGRMTNMGVPAYLVADTVVAILNQRLARRICSKCKEEYQPEEDQLRFLTEEQRDSIKTFYRGAGCPKCNHSGYKGRVGFYEYLTMSAAIRRMINEGKSEESILMKAMEEGFLTMRDYGVMKIREGVTTIDEVLRHTVDPLK